MGNRESVSSRGAGFLGMPRSATGWWSVGLAGAFIVLFSAWWMYLGQATTPRPEFFSDPIAAWLLIAAGAAGSGAAIVGVLALAAKRERSVLIMVSVLLGTVVLYATVGSLLGLNR